MNIGAVISKSINSVAISCKSKSNVERNKG